MAADTKISDRTVGIFFIEISYSHDESNRPSPNETTDSIVWPSNGHALLSQALVQAPAQPASPQNLWELFVVGSSVVPT
jgi:hypothetical protein